MKKICTLLFGLLFFSLVSGDVVGITEMGTIGGMNTIQDTSFNSPAPDLSFGVDEESVKELFSKKEICRLMKGCWEDIECFPNGYRIEDKYCNSERRRLINQSNIKESCHNSFECKSNFCFNGECVDTIKTIEDGVIRINKSDLEELRNIIENAEKSIEENYSEEISKNFFGSLISLFKKMFGWGE